MTFIHGIALPTLGAAATGVAATALTLSTAQSRLPRLLERLHGATPDLSQRTVLVCTGHRCAHTDRELAQRQESMSQRHSDLVTVDLRLGDRASAGQRRTAQASAQRLAHARTLSPACPHRTPRR